MILDLFPYLGLFIENICENQLKLRKEFLRNPAQDET